MSKQPNDGRTVSVGSLRAQSSSVNFRSARERIAKRGEARSLYLRRADVNRGAPCFERVRSRKRNGTVPRVTQTPLRIVGTIPRTPRAERKATERQRKPSPRF
ncbi:UNVERIFIED_CONTAM: hypothetical protein FKN15_006431 [Acipenser sinensis]